MVSEPPEEEEDGECEEVGVAFLRIPDILEQQQDLTETSLSSERTHTRTQAHRHARTHTTHCLRLAVVDLTDSSESLGTLTVTVEGLEALQAIMEDQDQETPVTSLLSQR